MERVGTAANSDAHSDAAAKNWADDYTRAHDPIANAVAENNSGHNSSDANANAGKSVANVFGQGVAGTESTAYSSTERSSHACSAGIVNAAKNNGIANSIQDDVDAESTAYSNP